MKKLIISAPFGNYFNFDNATSIIGTFTLHKRAGFFRRWWRVLKTVRYNWRQQSWINKLGLPNPGIDFIFNQNTTNKIISIHGFTEEEWIRLVGNLPCNQIIEFNLSCPNVGYKPSINEVSKAIDMTLQDGAIVIAKLPPIRWMDYAKPLYEIGVRYFHCCNTIATPGGGISGKPLMQYSLWAIQELRQSFGDSVKLIGGGGITNISDISQYQAAGADHYAIGSMLFNPLNWRKIKYL